jgi:inhibitor of KinA
MTQPAIPYRIFSLGDAAFSIEFQHESLMEANDQVHFFQEYFTHNPNPYIRSLVPAYRTLSFHVDLSALVFSKGRLSDVIDQVQNLLVQPLTTSTAPGILHRIPIRYDLDVAPDLGWALTYTGLQLSEFIEAHTRPVYRVFMLGFLPGFGYLGEVDSRIQLPRKPIPKPVKAGSVGIAGNQTGVYPGDSPGGWQLIGHSDFAFLQNGTPSLRAGDSVQFYPIVS